MVKLWRERPSLAFGAVRIMTLLNADNPTDVLAEQGRFALVAGRVLSVRESGAMIYVNFGRMSVILWRQASNRRSSPADRYGFAAGLKNAVARGSKRRDRSK